MLSIKSLSLVLLLSASTALVFAAPPAGNLIEEEIALNPETGIASGATRMGGQFFLQGLEKIGLFIGNPNTLHRADRVVMTFDATSLLRKAAKIKSARLVFYEEYIFGSDETRQIELVVFDEPLSELTEESLSSSEVQTVRILTVSAADQNKGGQAQGNPYEVEVTSQLVENIKNGKTGISFRLQDVKAEDEGNPNMETAGITIDQRTGFLPTIVVQMGR